MNPERMAGLIESASETFVREDLSFLPWDFR
jgi:hypothetical protein